MQRFFYLVGIFFFVVLQFACSSEINYAPVIDINGFESFPKSGRHKVMPGETLYAIAFRYGLDYRKLANKNQILAPYAIQPGQYIYLQNKKYNSKGEFNEYQIGKNISSETLSFNISSPSGWLMPAKGRIISMPKGINILGNFGEPIYATAAGKIVYCGDGLRGYGKLIIIKHSELYLSAYAHNRYIYVEEGQIVKQGQKIAEMGNSGTDKVMLHFEIRKAGKPVNPIPLLRS